jgi:hypothetical protein
MRINIDPEASSIVRIDEGRSYKVPDKVRLVLKAVGAGSQVSVSINGAVLFDTGITDHPPISYFRSRWSRSRRRGRGRGGLSGPGSAVVRHRLPLRVNSASRPVGAMNRHWRRVRSGEGCTRGELGPRARAGRGTFWAWRAHPGGLCLGRGKRRGLRREGLPEGLRTGHNSDGDGGERPGPQAKARQFSAVCCPPPGLLGKWSSTGARSERRSLRSQNRRPR